MCNRELRLTKIESSIKTDWGTHTLHHMEAVEFFYVGDYS